MKCMKNIEPSLEIKQLRLFLSLIESQSLTHTADSFGVGQSAISHSLNKLRAALDDPLFVRSGRGIKATPYALSIVKQVREALGLLDNLGVTPTFEIAAATGEVVIGANEYQRDMVLPRLFRKIQTIAPKLRMRVISNPLDTLELIRDEAVDLVLTPRPPDKGDVHSLQLNHDRQAIFYDPALSQPPLLEKDFLSAGYVVPEVIFDKATGCIHRAFAPVKGHEIVPKVVINTFAGIPQFLRGSDMLAPLPSKLSLMSGFASCFSPNTYHALSIYLCWHQRNHHSPLHQWLIKLITESRAQTERVKH